jgi:AraC family transcriptional regulator
MILSKGQYYGNVDSAKDISGIILTKSEYKKGSRLPKHYHQNPYCCFILNGNYTETYNKKNINCTKGDVVFHPHNTEHHNDFENTDASCFNIEYSGNWAERFNKPDFAINSILCSSAFNIQITASKIFREFHQPDSLSPLMVESLATELLVLFSRDTATRNEKPFFIRKVVKYIDENFSEPVSLSELAAIANVSSEHLVREFKKVFKVTIGEYIRNKRVNKACELLRYSGKEISEISFDLGFADNSHFTRVFKQATGYTPLTYRKSM